MFVMRLHRVLVALLAAITLLTCVIASTESNVVSSRVQSERPSSFEVSDTNVERSLQTKEDAPQAIDSEERGLNIDALGKTLENVNFNVWQRIKSTFQRMFSWLPWVKMNAEATKDTSKAVNTAKAPEGKLFSGLAKGLDGDGAVASPRNGQVLQSRNVDARTKVGEQGAEIKEVSGEGKAIPQAAARTNGDGRGTEVDPTKNLGDGDGEKSVVKVNAKNGPSEEVSGPGVVHAAGGGKSKTSIPTENTMNRGLWRVKAAIQAAGEQFIKAQRFANNQLKRLGPTKSEPLPKEETPMAHIPVETHKEKVVSDSKSTYLGRLREVAAENIRKVKNLGSKPKSELPQAEVPAARASAETKNEIDVSDNLTPGSPSGHATNNKPLDTNVKTPLAVENSESKNVVAASTKAAVSEHLPSAPHEIDDVNGGARLEKVKSTVSEPSSPRRNGDGEEEAGFEFIPTSPKHKTGETNLGEAEIHTLEASKKVHTPPADHVTGHDADGHRPENAVTSTENLRSV
uniref:Putative RxLR effector n=1 Tax=Plasmopara viticola TaxID=143451 RepID=A0A650F4Q5_PLAVT|nr:putative RxLR effector [Plasmopara viticola]